MSQFRRAVAAAVVVLLVASVSEAKHEPWIEVRSSNFIVVSNAGEKQARKAALQFEQIRAVFRQSIAVAKEHPSPFVTVLAAKDENTMRELLPEYWVKGHAHPAGLFTGRLNNYQAVVQLDAQGSNPYETFYHEYYHSITVPDFPDLPVWLSEGLAEFFGHTQIEDKYVGMGQSDDNLLLELNQQPLIPLNVLFNVDQSSPYYNEANRTSIFYAESWALTHYLMVGDRQAHKPLLFAYLGALGQGKSQDEAAAVAFGDLKKLQNTLQGYIHQALYFYLKLEPPKIVEEELKVRSLSEAEADAYRGGFAAVRGQTHEAMATLQEALRLDSNVALAHEYLAMAQFVDGQRDKALESASHAITLDPNNYFSRYLRALLVMSGSGIISNAQVEEDCRQAIALNPEFSPPYALLAVYLTAQNQNLEEALGLAQKAVSFQPGSSNYQLSLAQVLLRMNKFNEANLATARASAWARDPQEKANTESFKSYTQQVRQFQAQMAAAGSGQTETTSEAPSGNEALSAGQHLAPSSSGSTALPATTLHMQANITVLGSPSGVDPRPYLQEVIGRIRNKLLSPVSQHL